MTTTTTTTTAGDYATLSDALRAATGQLSGSPQSAHTAAAEAAAQLWHQQDGILTDPQVSTICHAARAAAEHSSTTLHSAAVSAHELDVPDVIDDDHISRTRASMMAALADAVTAHEHAADHLGSLRGPLCDLDLSDSRDGHDLAAHIDTAIRCGRAAYAVLHAITTA